jgi:hypothetical protein
MTKKYTSGTVNFEESRPSVFVLVPQMIVGISILICVMWIILYASFGQLGTQILAISLLVLFLVGVILLLIYAGHSMTKKTISETDRREYSQGSSSDAKVISALVQMAGRSQSDAVNIAKLISSETNRAIRETRQLTMSQMSAQSGMPMLTVQDEDEDDEPVSNRGNISADNISIRY